MDWTLVWILVIYQNNFITYSPPMATSKDCEVMFSTAKGLNPNVRGTCVQIDVARLSNERTK
jgi:hypothetical protein